MLHKHDSNVAAVVTLIAKKYRKMCTTATVVTWRIPPYSIHHNVYNVYNHYVIEVLQLLLTK